MCVVIKSSNEPQVQRTWVNLHRPFARVTRHAALGYAWGGCPSPKRRAT
jgi:hypothetical protein